MPLLVAAAFVAQVGVLQESGRQIEEFRRLARSAETEYEIQRRRLAPYTVGLSSDRCDERVGRFCLRFDDDETPEPIAPEDPRIADARDRAIEALDRAARYAPHDFRTLAGLVRLLIEAGRAEDAVSAAQRFVPADAQGAWKHLLTGVALQAAGWTAAAEEEFDRGLHALPPASRDSMLDLEPLLEGGEWKHYRSLDAAGQRAYEERLWHLSDPLFLLAGNERRAEHLARHTWSRILAEAPRGMSEPAWGEDLKQLTIRYGVPVSREKEVGSVGGGRGMVERYDTAQRSLVPEALATRGYPPAPAPGEESALFRNAARSGFAPTSVRRLLDMDPQVTRWAAAADSVRVRLDGQVVLDSIAATKRTARDSLLVGLFLLPQRTDAAGARVTQRHSIRGDTIRFVLEAVIPAGEYVLSAEAVEAGSRLAWRARYILDAHLPRRGDLALSDPVIARSYGNRPLPKARTSATLEPHGSLVLPSGAPVGVFLESSGLRADASGLARFRVQVKVEREDAPSIPVRAARWLGGLLGIAGAEPGAVLAWDGTAPAAERLPVAFDLDLAPLSPGLYRVDITLADHIAGTSATTTRVLRITDSRR